MQPAIAPDGTMTRREVNKREKLRRIVQSARNRFHDQGFVATTIAQIAQDAGVAEGTIFLYVARKEDLLILAFADEMGEVLRAAEAKANQTQGFVAQASCFFSSILSYHAQDIELARAYLREVGFYRDPSQTFGMDALSMRSLLGNIVQRAQDKGEICASFVPEEIGMMSFALYWYCLRGWVNEEICQSEFSKMLINMLSLQLTGLRPTTAS